MSITDTVVFPEADKILGLTYFTKFDVSLSEMILNLEHFSLALGSGFPGSGSKESACNARDLGSIPGSGKSPAGENGNPLHYFCLENSMDRGTWQAIMHGVAKSWT